jgi:hypothetical protein
VSDDPTGPKDWELANKGRAKQAFEAANGPAGSAERSDGAAPVAQQGVPRVPEPQLTPPGPIRQMVDHAVQAENNDRKTDRVRFIKAVVSEKSRQEKEKSIELKNEFNKGKDR